MGDPQSQKGLTYTKSLSAHDLDDVGAPPRHRKPQNSTLSIPQNPKGCWRPGRTHGGRETQCGTTLHLGDARQLWLGEVLGGTVEVTNEAQSGWWYTYPSDKYESQLELVFPIYGYGSIPINTIFSGMNIHLPAILGFTRYQGFDPSPYGYC